MNEHDRQLVAGCIGGPHVRGSDAHCEHCQEHSVNPRWAPFTDDEIRTIFVEMTTDDGIPYSYSQGDEPAYTIYRELIAEIKRRDINQIVV